MKNPSTTAANLLAKADNEIARIGEQIRTLRIQQGKWRDLSMAYTAQYDGLEGADADLEAALDALGLSVDVRRAA